mmetsp:Transcript_66569/g.124217  ORF Transcript_66569/g.124217 Transcript_66569/m.124217 type:complete len:655 (+) Transcript_66569:49-2013(+)
MAEHVNDPPEQPEPPVRNSVRLSNRWQAMRLTQMSAFTTVTLHTSFSDAMEQFGLSLEELKSTMATQHQVNSWTQIKVLALLVLNPVVRGYRAVGMGFAKQESEGFSVVMPALLSSITQLVITFVLLLLMDGFQEARRLFKARYAIMIIPGFAAGAMILLANMAYARLATSVVTLLLQTSALFAVLLQCALFRRIPSHTQILSLVATGSLLPVYFMQTNSTDGEEGTNSDADIIKGIAFSLAGAFSTAFYNICFEWANKKCKLPTDDFSAALKRAMVSCEVGRLLMCILLLLTMDYDFVVNKGVFHNFDMAVLVGATGGLVVQGFFASLCLAFVGAVMTRLSSSLEIIVVYIADLALLQTAEFEVENVLILAAIFAVVLLYHISALDQQKAARAAALSVIKTTEENWKIASEKAGDRTPHSKRTLEKPLGLPFRGSTTSHFSSYFGSQAEEPASKRGSANMSLEGHVEGSASRRASARSDRTDEAASKRASAVQSLEGDGDEAAPLKVSCVTPDTTSTDVSSHTDRGLVVPWHVKGGSSRSNAQVQQARALSRSSEGNLEVGREGEPSFAEGSKAFAHNVSSGVPLEDEVQVGALSQQMVTPGDMEPPPVLLGRSLGPCMSRNHKLVDSLPEGIAGGGQRQDDNPFLCSITCNM